MLVRLYKKSDQSTIRKIACDTADLGNPLENIFHDREMIADILIKYYTDYEPGSLWVAEHENQAVGYLTGCLDTHRYNRILMLYIFPAAFFCAVLRGVLFYRQTWRLIISALKTIIAGGLSGRVPLKKYPAHLHINIQAEFRGQNIGQGLMERFIEQVKQKGLPGIHLSTRMDNTKGRRFFERMGFRLFSTHPVIIAGRNAYKKISAAIYVKEITEGVHK